MTATVYWRPGCPFCLRLRVALGLRRLRVDWVNIHEDPAAAEYVRSVADGNETVPTVVVGDSVRVNPPPREVVAAIRGGGQLGKASGR